MKSITMNYFKFEPLLKQTLWGGDKIIPFKSLHENMENVGESWEISGVKDNETIAVGDNAIPQPTGTRVERTAGG